MDWTGIIYIPIYNYFIHVDFDIVSFFLHDSIASVKTTLVYMACI